jgi:AAA-like domain
MFSSSQRSKRKRGVVLSSHGWQRLKSAQTAAEISNNHGDRYTQEDLNELTGLSYHTLTKVRRRQKPVDLQTLECYFKAFGLTLMPNDYAKPYAKPISKSIANQSQTTLRDDSGLNPADSEYNHEPNEPTLPDGQVALDSLFYVELTAVETQCYRTVLQPGSLIRIKAPRRRGKTSLMVRILNQAALQGCQKVFLSLQLVDREILQNLDKFLQWFSASVGLGMGLPNRLDDYWDELFGSKVSCKIYFEQYLLAKSPQPLVLALDDVDILFDYPELADEFFGLLRTWHEQAKNRGVWQQLRLMVAHSTEVYIPLNLNKSPFNVGLPIELEPFSTEQVEYLAQQYDLELSSTTIEQLMTISNGQPYLVQLGLYALWQDNVSLTEILHQAIEGTGIYANHLQRLLWTLQQDLSLAEAFTQVLQASDPVEVELLPAFKLESLGLVELQGNRATPSCALYAEYFLDRLN